VTIDIYIDKASSFRGEPVSYYHHADVSWTVDDKDTLDLDTLRDMQFELEAHITDWIKLAHKNYIEKKEKIRK
jgi:hypothetical protein